MLLFPVPKRSVLKSAAEYVAVVLLKLIIITGRPPRFKPKVELEAMGDLDAVFFCTPSGEAMKDVKKYLDKGVKVVDLSADFRFKNANRYEQVYGRKHVCPELLEEAVYGITEFNREKIKGARLIANPGCYVITTMLGLAPLIENKVIQLSNIPINAINGTTGGKGILHTDAYGNVMPYNMEGHRHSSELEEQIGIIAGEDKEPMVNFSTAHRPFDRGIYSVTSPLVREDFKSWNREKFLELFKEFYKNEYFVRINDFTKIKSGKIGRAHV